MVTILWVVRMAMGVGTLALSKGKAEPASTERFLLLFGFAVLGVIYLLEKGAMYMTARAGTVTMLAAIGSCPIPRRPKLSPQADKH